MINNRLLSGCGCKSTAGREVLEGAADGYMMGAITGFITGGMTSKQCFVAGTSILTSAGIVAIENIQAGDLVWASDPETGETALKPVVQTLRTRLPNWLMILNMNVCLMVIWR